MCHSRPLFSFTMIIICRWLDSNCRSLVSKAITIPTAPQPLAKLFSLVCVQIGKCLFNKEKLFLTLSPATTVHAVCRWTKFAFVLWKKNLKKGEERRLPLLLLMRIASDDIRSIRINHFRKFRRVLWIVANFVTLSEPVNDVLYLSVCLSPSFCPKAC